MDRHRYGIHWLNVHDRSHDKDHVRQLGPSAIKLVAGDVPDVSWVSWTHEAVPNDCLIILRSHAMSEQKQDMSLEPIKTGERHAIEWRAHVDRMREEAEGRGLPFPSDIQLCVLGINEPPVWSALQQAVNYNVAFCDMASNLGLRVGALSLSVGWPANSGDGTPPNWEPYEHVRKAIVDGGHWLVLHEYWADRGPEENWGWWGGRYIQCPWDVPIIIGECGLDMYVKDPSVPTDNRGWFGRMSAAHYADELSWYHDAAVADGRVVSVMPFTMDYSDPWRSFDTATAQPAIVERAREFEESLPPKPPDTDERLKRLERVFDAMCREWLGNN